MLRRGSIYCEAVFQPQDVYYEGSEDEDYDDAVARKQRYEAAGQQFLAGKVPLLLSATLKGPFEEESGWVNPWRSKNRTAHSQTRPESQNVGSQHSPKRPAASAFIERQAAGALKSAECALPSPESLKQAPFTKAHSRLQHKEAVMDAWRDDEVPLPLNDDGFWEAGSPSRNPNKRKSKSSRWLNSVTYKRQRTESVEPEAETPTLGRSRTNKTDIGKTRTTTTKPSVRSSSIYTHIRELTSRLPPGGSQDISSEDEDADDADDDEDVSTRSSIDLSLTNASLPSGRQKILGENDYSSSPLSSAFSQPSLLRAFSPVSSSPAQSPTKLEFAGAKVSSRQRPLRRFSSFSKAPTTLSSLSDLEMLGGDDDNDYTGSTVLPGPQPQEDHFWSPETSETNDRVRISATPDSIPVAALTAGSDYEEHTLSEDDATRAQNADDSIQLDDLKLDYDIPRGNVMPFCTTQTSRMADPLIYDDAEGSNQPAPGSSNMAPSGSPQLAVSLVEPANSSGLEKSQALDDSKLVKAKSPYKSPPLRSLSPRNGRINSRPALKKIIQPYISSLYKSPTVNADEILFAKENVQTKENSSSSVVNISPLVSRPNLNEIATSLNCEPDHSKAANAQEEPVAHGTSVLSTISCFSPPLVEAASYGEVEDVTQEDVLPNILEQAESSPTQQKLPTDSLPFPPVEHADLLETQTNENASEEPSEPCSTTPVTDGHSWAHQQEQQNEAPAPTEVAESAITTQTSIDTPQPPAKELPEFTEQVSERASTPEPQFAFTSFSSFMSPSPKHHRRGTRSFDRDLNSVGPKSQGILISTMKKSWRSAMPKKKVSWAPLPHEETNSSGDNSEMDPSSSSSLSRGRERAVSPPPPSMGLSSNSLSQGDLRFSDHFAAVADRSKGTKLQSEPIESEHRSCSPDRQVSVEKFTAPQAEKKSLVTQKDGSDDEPIDIVQDIFDEMDDFLQVWDVDAELNEARKAEKARATSKKETETLQEIDMDMSTSFF
ncbi:hypothetical protein V8C37DRAFT_376931 [Trichoderma ceciliae]